MPRVGTFKEVQGVAREQVQQQDATREALRPAQKHDNTIVERYHLAADSAAADTLSERVAHTIHHQRVLTDVQYTPASTVTANSSDYVDLIVSKRDGKGGDAVQVGRVNTATTSIQANQPTSIEVSSTNDPRCIPGDVVTVQYSKAGAGVQLPDGQLTFIYAEND